MPPKHIPGPEEPTFSDDLPTVISRMIRRHIRTKPSYSDCWMLEDPEDASVLSSYIVDCGTVVIYDTNEGEVEYSIRPNEFYYPDDVNSMIVEVIDRLRKEHLESGISISRESVIDRAKDIISDKMTEIKGLPDNEIDKDALIDDLCEVVYRYSVGMGIFEILLRDPHIEDIYLDAPCTENRIHVTLNGIKGVNSHMRCRTNLMVEQREMDNLVNILKRSSGLRFNHSEPIMETDFPDYEARATLIGYPMSPKGPALAIRKHSIRPWTLSRLVFNGTLSPEQAGILSFLVDNHCTFLICGPRGAGKSSLLSALMFEFSKEQRILTIEDTLELPGELMRHLGYKIQSMLLDDHLEGDQHTRANEALRVSLRLGESAIILGEVRGSEASVLYQSMRAGRAGSSVMGTIHGDSAESVYQRVVNDLGVPPDSFAATEVVITMGTVRDDRTGRLIRRLEEIVCTTSEPGEFRDISRPGLLMISDISKKILKTSQLGKKEAYKEIETRAQMREILAEHAIDDEKFLDPEWILVSNDILRRNKGRPIGNIYNEFMERIGA